MRSTPWPLVHAIEVVGLEQAERRVTVPRVLALGLLALAYPDAPG
jgi:hypothetical protein